MELSQPPVIYVRRFNHPTAIESWFEEHQKEWDSFKIISHQLVSFDGELVTEIIVEAALYE